MTDLTETKPTDTCRLSDNLSESEDKEGGQQWSFARHAVTGVYTCQKYWGQTNILGGKKGC